MAGRIEALAAKNLWTSSGGATPHATLYSALLREINAKGKDARFGKVDRGQFSAKKIARAVKFVLLYAHGANRRGVLFGVGPIPRSRLIIPASHSRLPRPCANIANPLGVKDSAGESNANTLTGTWSIRRDALPPTLSRAVHPPGYQHGRRPHYADNRERRQR
jgi:hypothetical protein